MSSETINVGIGFATGRKNFKNVLNSFIYHLDESGLLKDGVIHLHLFVAYDLEYSGTKLTDYTKISPNIKRNFEKLYFIGNRDIQEEIQNLISKGVLQGDEANLCFGNGYAAKRNIIVYSALKNNIDYLIFLDDDEYPMAVTESKDFLLWSGQHVLESHIKYLRNADITNGYHCGYVSPIPFIAFDNILSEQDFRNFIEALSNDVLNWDSIKSIINNGGITYADKKILIEQMPSPADEVNGAKFITGGNLGLNLTNPDKIFPFYNPPHARGEDTFLSTCLEKVNVKYIPSYTFHDGFSIYSSLLKGVLPNRLKRIETFSEQVITRFYSACVGWVRYKPLYTYITLRNRYEEIIGQMRESLEEVTPKICSYFNRGKFMDILTELNRYDQNVKVHYEEFEKTKEIWEKVKSSLLYQ